MQTKKTHKVDYLAITSAIEDLLRKAAKKGGLDKLSTEETKILAKLSKIAERYEDMVLKIMPLTPIKQTSEKSLLEHLLGIKSKPLKISDLISIANKYELNPTQTANLADLSLRTFKSKRKSTILSVNVSEKIVRLEALYQLGLTVFDDNNSSLVSWLKTPVPALKSIPNDLLTTHLGIDIVKEELLRIKFSVY